MINEAVLASDLGYNRYEFPFELDTQASFLIINETTLAERLFTYQEVIDGTYDTWLNGAEGGIKKWNYGDLSLNSGTSTFIRLKSNAGNPYLNDWDQNANLGVVSYIMMSGDWIITLILDKELNVNNQRLNLGVRGNTSKLFGLQLYADGRGFIVIDRLTGGTSIPDYEFNYPTTTAFKLFTFTKISGVFETRINNSVVALTPNTGAFIITDQISANSIVLGSRSYPNAGLGKITNYQHIKVKTGNDLSSLDISAYNQSIMTKYSIT